MGIFDNNLQGSYRKIIKVVRIVILNPLETLRHKQSKFTISIAFPTEILFLIS